VHQEEPVKRFYIVTRGKAEAVVKTPLGSEIVVGEISQGQFFGETGLLRQGAGDVTVRASADSEVEAVSLDMDSFRELLGRSEETRRDIEKVASERLMQIAVGQKDVCHV
jgi:CRP-like cAMP-binding protein